jgi:methionine synthase I (cobalamin-dependent)
MTSWQDKVANRDILIIDGAMGTELERRGVPMHAETWAGAALIEHPDKVRQAHLDYIVAGAELIITNTFGASPHMLNAMGHGADAEKIIRGAVKLAQEAREESGKDVAIAGSISTMSAGSDTADPGDRHTTEEIRDSMFRMADALAAGGCDMIALEMMQDLTRAPIAMEAARQTGTRAATPWSPSIFPAPPSSRSSTACCPWAPTWFRLCTPMSMPPPWRSTW